MRRNDRARLFVAMCGACIIVGSAACHPNAGNQTDGPISIGGDMGIGPGPTAAEACAAAAKAQCQKQNECSAFSFSVAYPDMATCMARIQPDCPARLSLQGTSATPQRLLSCAQALSGVSCADFLSGNQGPACNPSPGAIADGAVCADDAQCKSTLCRLDDTGCGKCVPRAKVGQSCAQSGCDFGLICGAQLCVKRGAMGDACAATAPCQPGLACQTGKCGMPAALGDPCIPAAQVCDAIKGMACDAPTMTCQQIKAARSGEMCGIVGKGVVICLGGTSCVTNVCTAPIKDGQMCNPDDGPSCLTPANCTNGTCTIADPAACK